MLGPSFSEVGNDIECIKLLRTETGFVGHLLSESQFRLGPPEILLKMFTTTTSLLHPLLPCRSKAHTLLSYVKGENSLFQQERVKKKELLA